MTEREKMLAGVGYDASDDDLKAARMRAKMLCRKFNEETDDGRNMQAVSELLTDAINSIIDVKEGSDIDSLFSAGGTSALLSEINGLDDFELICFLAVK